MTQHALWYAAVVTATYDVKVYTDDPLEVPEMALSAIRKTNPTDCSITHIREVAQ